MGPILNRMLTKAQYSSLLERQHIREVALMKPRALLVLALLSAALFASVPAAAATAPTAAPFVLTILHVNDTHSMLEPSQVRLTMDLSDTLKGRAVYVNLGGFATAMAAVERLRSDGGNVLFLHAGDMFQGSLYFTEYNGAADVDFWNTMGVDVATLGNHEFDKGPGLIQTALLEKASFAVTSANVNVANEQSITSKDRLQPWVIREIEGQKIGIIGITTPDTPFISSPGRNVVFSDPATAVNGAVAALEAKGVNKIIVLTHEGFEADKALAAKVHDVDIIVGGHSHTLLGDYPSVGLHGVDSYPFMAKDADGQSIPIVQAWQWAYQIGRIALTFDSAGKVTAIDARPLFVMAKGWARIYDLPNLAGAPQRVQFAETDGKLEVTEYDGARYSRSISDTSSAQYAAYALAYRGLDAKLSRDPAVLWLDPSPAGLQKLAGYARGVAALRDTIVATVTEDMKRGENTGPGPIIADSMTWKTGAQVAVMNPGGVRTDLVAGDLSVAKVYELQPFGDTLVTLGVTGTQLLSILEDMADFTVTSYGKAPGTHHLYVSGMKLSLDVDEMKGRRISNAEVKQPGGAYAPLEPAATYSLVVNNFMAAGGDNNTTLASLSGKYDTGFIDSEAMLAYVNGKRLANLDEVRVDRRR